MSTVDTVKAQRLLQIIRENSLSRGETYTLASGSESDYYFNMKNTTLDPEGANLIAELLYSIVEKEKVDFIGGLASGAIPIVTAVCSHSLYGGRKIKGFYVREEAKEHGQRKLIEGYIENGANVIILDDVTTAGSSAMKAVEAVRARHCNVVRVISVVDRLEGATETFRREGLSFVSLFTTNDFRDSDNEI
jgi:orotate phosphoribosyltransferase